MDSKHTFRAHTDMPLDSQLYRFGEDQATAVRDLRRALTFRKIDPDTKTITVVDQRTGSTVLVVSAKEGG
jgi:hypothetical protein